MKIEEALEQWENSGGLACSDPHEDGTVEVLFTLAQAYVNEQADNATLRAACEAALERLTTIAVVCPHFGGEPINQLRAALAAGKGEAHAN